MSAQFAWKNCCDRDTKSPLWITYPPAIAMQFLREPSFISWISVTARRLSQILAAKSYDAVFHFAAKALIPESIINPAAFYQVNVVAAAAMMDAICEAGIQCFIFSSTAAVYGNPIEVPITEDHPNIPVNAYGETKLSFERLLAWYANAYGISVCAFRYFSAAGATAERGEEHEPETHVLPLLLEAALENANTSPSTALITPPPMEAASATSYTYWTSRRLIFWPSRPWTSLASPSTTLG